MFNGTEIRTLIIANDELVKSHLNEALGGWDQFKIEKTGAQIAEKLTQVIASEKAEILQSKNTLSELLTQIDGAPSEPFEENYEGEDGLEAANQYPWRDTYCENAENVSDDVKKQCELKRLYNQTLSKVSRALSSIANANVFIDNVDKEKTFELSLRQAKALGF